jgi:quercetin dioxygenase-like cupin family protein
MKVVHYTDVEAEGPDGYAPGVYLRPVISPADGAPHFTMRVFEVDPEGHTPFHQHAWEHEVFVLRGEGTLRSEQGNVDLREGIVVFIPGGEKHQFLNTGDTVLQFLCVIPNPTT